MPFALTLAQNLTPIAVRLNQVGYRTGDSKTAIVCSRPKHTDKIFHLHDDQGREVFTGRLSKDKGRYLAFNHHYLADFSKFQATGKFTLAVNGAVSPQFTIANDVFKNIPDSLLQFFRVQRCGDNQPYLHALCHLGDAAKVDGDPSIPEALSLTGGWHDAGDYIKFTITTAFTTYLLLLTYQDHPNLIPDRDGNGRSDLLDEAVVGLDWLLKANYAPGKVIHQVQSLQDHNVGWRLPDKDTLDHRRIAYFRPSKAVYGSVAAALALGNQVLYQQSSEDYAGRLLNSAKDIWNAAQTDIPDSACGPDSMYFDQTANDNLALAAVELCYAEGDEAYLDTAKALLNRFDKVFWLSWGDVAGLAWGRLGELYQGGFKKLYEALEFFDKTAGKNPFGYPLENFPWGSSSLQLGTALLGIMYQDITGSDRFNGLVIRQRDYILGANSYGVSFIGGWGTEFPRHFHSQVGRLSGQPLPGAVAEGLVDAKIFFKSGIKLAYKDRFEEFQTKIAVYHDDYEDYLTNEPTICGNALALYVFAGEADR
ncbi:MAG: glycoside hydrolase family 9 protein [Calditrichota bacterium]